MSNVHSLLQQYKQYSRRTKAGMAIPKNSLFNCRFRALDSSSSLASTEATDSEIFSLEGLDELCFLTEKAGILRDSKEPHLCTGLVLPTRRFGDNASTASRVSTELRANRKTDRTIRIVIPLGTVRCRSRRGSIVLVSADGDEAKVRRAKDRRIAAARDLVHE